MNILIVDDEPIMLHSILIALETYGHQVITSKSSGDAWNLILQKPLSIDIIVTDYLMPDINGLLLLKMVREKYPDLPVILMTAYSETSLVIQALKHRCDGFIEKPFTPDQLYAEIERVKNDRDSVLSENLQIWKLPEIVHQINNPLSAITGYAQLIQMKSAGESHMQVYAKKIIDAVYQIHRINKMFMHQKLEENPQKTYSMATEPVAMTALLESCIHFFDGNFLIEGIQIYKELPKTQCYVLGNAFYIEQMINNLISNAIDAMRNAKQKILTLSMNKTDDGRYVDVKIADTGHGIDANHLDKIFDSHFTLKADGNGLGLAIVKQVIDNHKGTISIQSSLGKGTLFVVRLPVYEMDKENSP